MSKLTPETLQRAVTQIKESRDQSGSFIFIRSESGVFFANGEKAGPEDVRRLQDEMDIDDSIVDSGTIIMDSIITPNILVCGTLLQEGFRDDSAADRQATVELVRTLARMVAGQPVVSGME